MSKSVLHVVPHNDAWAVKREGNERASSTHPTQKEAIDAARELARELDDIVIHRADGTIRERVTYYGESGQPTNGERTEERTERRTLTEREARVQDLVSVGRRVSWGAVFAGAIIALATYITLSLLALAIGLTATDGRADARNAAITAAIIAGVILLASMFLGGFVAARATAGETRSEAASYGVLVWGTVFLLLTLGGLGFGIGHLSGMRQMAMISQPTVSAERMRHELGLTQEQVQQYQAMTRDPQAMAGADATEAAWWAFAGVALSILAAIGGGLVGAGPEFALRRTTEGGAVVAPRPA